jgi:Fe-S-cluster-containing hydrogenase component 2
MNKKGITADNPVKQGIVSHKSGYEKIAVRIELCHKCGGCVAVCPCDAIFLHKGEFPVINDKCSKCKRCIDVCPVGIIFINNEPYI